MTHATPPREGQEPRPHTAPDRYDGEAQGPHDPDCFECPPFARCATNAAWIAEDLETRKATASIRLECALDDLATYLDRFMVFERAHGTAVTLWTAYSHFFGHGQPYSYVPYLLVTSAEKQSGKSLLKELIQETCHEPLDTCGTTAAFLKRSCLGRTTLVDEIDQVFTRTSGETDNGDLRAILNAGFKFDGKLSTVNKTTMKPEEWPVFGPKALFGIGQTVPDTIVDRSISIRLERKNAAIQRERGRHSVIEKAGAALREQLRALAAEIGVLGLIDTFPNDLSDRGCDIWEPLFALADAAGPAWSARARNASVDLIDHDTVMSVNEQLLMDLYHLWQQEDNPNFMSTKDIIGRPENPDPAFGHEASGLCAFDEARWSNWSRGKPITAHVLGKKLGEYGLRSNREPVGHGYGPKGYFRADLERVWTIYTEPKLAADTSDSFDSALHTQVQAQTGGVRRGEGPTPPSVRGGRAPVRGLGGREGPRRRDDRHQGWRQRGLTPSNRDTSTAPFRR